MPLPPCPPSFVSLHDLHSGLLLAAAALFPFHKFPSFVSLQSLSFDSQCRFLCLSFVSPCRFLCPPPPTSPFIACHLSPSFFGNAIWGLCRCNFSNNYFFLKKINQNYQIIIISLSYFSNLFPLQNFHSILNCRYIRPYSTNLFSFIISILDYSWLSNPPSFISFLGYI